MSTQSFTPVLEKKKYDGHTRVTFHEFCTCNQEGNGK